MKIDEVKTEHAEISRRYQGWGIHPQGEYWEAIDKPRYEKLATFIQGYEAKEAELKGALIIPEGWEILEARHDRGQFKCILEPTKGYIHQRLAGYGDTTHKALRNALEQIDNTKN